MPKGIYLRKEKDVVQKEEVAEKVCSICKHSEKMHYGSADKWCNVKDCKCLYLA